MGTIDLLGYNGKTYQFNLYTIGTSFKSLSGVYVFLKENSNGLMSIIYIGETDNFEERLNLNIKNHQQYKCISLNYPTHIALLTVSGIRQNRLDIETNLRRNYSKSSCNDQ